MTACKWMMAILITLGANAIAQTSFWGQSASPALPQVSSTTSVTLGLKFYSDVPGTIAGIRFYKGSNNTGTHTGNVWSAAGTKLASVTFSGETASGWQQATFSSPVAITANTTYVVSYTAPNGSYSLDQSYLWSSLNAGALHVAGSSPGVYTYGTGAMFPASTWNNSNYWVDVVFVPAGSLISFWPQSTTPGLGETSDMSSVTLGLKFYSDTPGSVTGIRFYKGLNNTGTHTGDLWSGTGAKLASVKFSGETASGWQQMAFSVPVNITANTTYVISYTAPKGRYAQDQNYPWSSLTSGSLHPAGSLPGVYTYGTGSLFPTSNWNNSNYWVDVMFKPASPSTPPPSSGPDPVATTYSISGNVRGSGATLTLSGAASRVATTDGSGNYSFTGLANGSYVVAASQSGYTFTPATVSSTINGAVVTGVDFTSTAVVTPVAHTVLVSWTPSTSLNIAGYNIYRADVAGGAYTKANPALIVANSFNDSSVASGRTYYYVATAVDGSNNESSYSSQTTAVVPTP